MHLLLFLIKFAAAVMILTFSSVKFTYLSFYHCSRNMVHAILVEHTMFEWPSS